jgi:hypothetical protein
VINRDPLLGHDQMKRLSSNKELYDYLVDLAEELRVRGSDSLANVVLFAADQAGGFSTEFLGESRIALEKVLNSGKAPLKENEKADLLRVIERLSQALTSRR